jgi:hypothetical protein
MKLLIALLFSVNAMAAFTPFPPASPPADSITAKGNLLTSDGAAQAEFGACADDEILVWDAAELAGMKCEAKPSAGPAQVYLQGPSTNTVQCAAFPALSSVATFNNVSTTGGAIKLGFRPRTNIARSDLGDNPGQLGMSPSVAFLIGLYRNGVLVQSFRFDGPSTNTNYPLSALSFSDNPAAGLYNYEVKCGCGFGTACFINDFEAYFVIN